MKKQTQRIFCDTHIWNNDEEIQVHASAIYVPEDGSYVEISVTYQDREIHDAIYKDKSAMDAIYDALEEARTQERFEDYTTSNPDDHE